MIGCEYYSSYYTLQKKILEETQAFQVRIRRIETYKLIENSATGKQTDIRDLIKKCPNCGLIWFRIESCPNTTCGNRPSCFFDFLKNGFSHFKITRKGKKFTVTRATKENMLKKNENAQNKAIKEYKTTTHLGCNQPMNF